MKLAISGKGGVGKTTLASLLVQIYAQEGKTVLAIDANPDANLALALGIPADEAGRLVPISEMKDLVAERTGASPGSFGGYFKLNPRVDDIPERFSLRLGNIRLLVTGTVKKSGSGCLCPESALVKALVDHVILERSEIMIMDMEAGVEHLGRGTARAVDAFIIVVEPGLRSIQTARAIRPLAQELGVPHVFIAGSKTRNDQDVRYIVNSLPDFVLLGCIHYYPEITHADREGKSAFLSCPQAVGDAKRIKEGLEEWLRRQSQTSP
ncbi:MAG: carbon monoxide dehydrogenase accessory protein CooC [Chloroflexota bacterium]